MASLKGLAHFLVSESLFDKTARESGPSHDDAPVVRFINNLLVDAINQGASDVHFEPYESTYRVRFRQDGILYEIANPPTAFASRMTSRLKIMAQLDISERRIPQDGRFKMMLPGNRYTDFRISTCPTLHGEKIVMRILDSTNAHIDIGELGFSPPQKELFLKNIQKSQGMILVTGPTGSGKTMTIYTALTFLNTPQVNILTVENPVEIYLPGINQVNINPKTGLTFSTTLRAFLRQDPDIIMVGEMRDLETAEIGIKAAQTGHLVLSTLHTNGALQTLSRLLNMGIPNYDIAESVSMIVAQRLVRKLCEFCKSPLLMGDQITYRAVGCDRCRGGYKGRMGIFEMLTITPDLGQIIMKSSNMVDVVGQVRQQGISTLYESGIEKIKQGMTSLDEIRRMTVD